VNEISKDYKIKLFSLSKEDFNYNNEASTWKIVKAIDTVKGRNSNKSLLKQMESVCEFCSKVTMNPSIQQIILSTPSCNADFLTKISRSSSLILNNPSNKNRLQSIIEQLVEKLNPGQLKSVKTSLMSNMTIVQTPSGTNKI